MKKEPKSYRKFLSTAATAVVVGTALVPVASASEVEVINAVNFTDVDGSFWASESINKLAKQGIINGYPSG